MVQSLPAKHGPSQRCQARDRSGFDERAMGFGNAAARGGISDLTGKSAMNYVRRAVEIDELRRAVDRGSVCSGYLWKERDAIAALSRTARAAYFAAEIKKVADAIRRLSNAELFDIVR
jgi:hypothetical protein